MMLKRKSDGKEGIMMGKLRGWMDKEGHYDVEMKWWMQRGCNMMCKLKGRMDKGGNYDVEMIKVDAKGGIMICKLRWTGWIREGIMMWK